MRHAAVLVAVLGCKAHHDAPKAVPGDGGFIAEPSMGGDPDGLPFVMTSVVPGQQPTDHAPWHADGGTWTYFEAHLAGDDAATFAALVPTFGPDMFGKMRLVPTTAAAGARVVAAYAKTFDVPVPPVVAGGELQPLELGLAVLGENSGRGDGFSGEGTWTATKWFCTTDAVEEAEVFFNFSFVEKQGELSEKDTDYDADIASCLATALRDGQPPPRTTANDPTLSTTGPTLVLGKKVADRPARPIAVTARKILLSLDDGTHGRLFAVDPETAATTTVLEVTDRIDGGDCNADASVCALALSTPSDERNSYSSADTSRVVLLVGAKTTPVPIDGPSSPRLSPDAAWVVAAGKDELVAWNRTTKRTVKVAVPEEAYADIYGWKDTKGHAIARVAVTTLATDETAAYTWDLDGAGTLVASTDTPPEDGEAVVDPVSPDGTRRADFSEDGTLTVTPLPAGRARTLVFHPSDRRAATPGCCQWLDSRYLDLPGHDFGFIDTDTMKVSFVPHDLSGDEPEIVIAPGMAIAVVDRDDGTYLATVKKP